jgi:hypothetical protein
MFLVTPGDSDCGIHKGDAPLLDSSKKLEQCQLKDAHGPIRAETVTGFQI